MPPSLALWLLAAGLIASTWLGYPLWLRIAAGGPPPPLAQPAEEPPVTVLITAWNAAELIAARVRDVLAQDYSAEHLRVVVASDGSNDATVARARSVSDPRVTALQFPRGGKSQTQNAAMAHIATGTIVVFTDADSRFAPGCLRALVAPFSEPRVGCTSGRLEVARGEGGIAMGQSAYWRYEMFLRRAESRRGMLATASGACMALRRELFRPLPPSVGEDCIVPLDVVLRGYRVVHVDGAIAVDRMPSSLRGELRARARMVSRNLYGIFARRALLSPMRYPAYAAGLWGHKILRWATPMFALAALTASVFLPTEYRLLDVPEVAYFALAAIGAACHAARRPAPRIFAMPFSFLAANLGFLQGWLRFVSGRVPVSYANLGTTPDRTI